MNTDRSESIASLAAALAKAQGRIEGARKDAEAKVTDRITRRYADLASVWDACREALSANGLAVVQAPAVADGGYVLHTTLLHESGEWMRSTLPLLSDTTGRTAMQALGSAITYGRRYGLMSMVGVCPEDDDGEAAGTPQNARHEARPANGHSRPAQPPPPRHEPPRPPRERWEAWLGKLLARWEAAEPYDPDADPAKERESRSHRIAHALITAAMESGRLTEAQILSAGKRTPRKVWEAVHQLAELDWDFVHAATLAHLQKHVQARPAGELDAPDGDPEFAETTHQREPGED